jgi:hypothetical protein
MWYLPGEGIDIDLSGKIPEIENNKKTLLFDFSVKS